MAKVIGIALVIGFLVYLSRRRFVLTVGSEPTPTEKTES